MGRRSINTTKSGKYMNPTDQARKEARKKELKKNKKQRQMVRAAVLKMKDPHQILDELEKIDEMEYNVLQPSPLNEKVLKEKRKKLKETFDRVLKMYDKDEPEKWVDLKRQEMDYEKKRSHLISYYESVKHAQSVQLDDIPLPTAQLPENQLFSGVTTQIPLPSEPGIPQPPIKPILKKDSAYKERPSGVEPPGVPPGPPPDFMNLLLEHEKEHTGYKDHKCLDKRSIRFIEDEGPPGETVPSILQEPENFDGEELDHVTEPPQPPVPGRPAAPPAVTPKPTSLQQRMLALSGQNIDDFMKEMEEVHKKRERDRAADLNARLSALKRKDRPLGGDSESDSDSEMPAEPPQPPPALASLPEPPGTVPLMPPQPISVMQSLMSALRPPPLRAPMGPPPLRMPPGPPPGRPGAPPGPPPGLPPRAILRPPGPPPGAPPRLLRPLVPPPPQHKPQLPVSVLTAAPMLLPKKDGAQGATISAKPQIRNLSADVTRFVPSALRVKREDKKMKPGVKPGAPQRAPALPKQAPTKDDAYMQFMREMEGLL